VLARVEPAARLQGEVRVPGDKSVSHRALLLNAIADGTAHVRGLSSGDDVASTAACLRGLGVSIAADAEGGSCRVGGRGLHGLREPAAPLDCGNSGTTMRLLAGLLAGQPFLSTLVGDASLSQRPMGRVAEPLRRMGAGAETDPLRVGGGNLEAIDYESSVASAQVKSAVLLAGLYARGTTRVTAPAPTRDHTERMLAAMGAPVGSSNGGRTASVTGPVTALRPLEVDVPGDLSSAAFWLVAGALHPAASVRLAGVGVNETRSGLLEVLERAGLGARRGGGRVAGAEPVADLEAATAASPRPLQIAGADAAGIVDELPVLAVAAARLPGTSRISDASELRVKESDRIAAIASGLSAMGADVTELVDGWEIRGPSRLRGARVASRGDHRVAMALAIGGLLAEGVTEIEDAECVGVSYPAFWRDLEALRAG
jgi:3-phosphoshikimate 1-carboxyvinyltransferase